MAKNKKEQILKNEYELEISALYKYYEQKLIRIALARFNYTIPSDIYLPKKVIPLKFLQGKCLAYNDSVKGLIIPNFAPCEGLDFYGYPTEYELFSTNNEYLEKVKADNENLIIGIANLLELPYWDYIVLYAKELAVIDLIRHQNLKLSRGFITAETPKEQELTIKQVINDWLGFEQFTLLTDKYTGTFNVEGKEITFKGNEYNQFKKSIFGEYLELLGIKSIDIEKGSHILNAEASRSEASTLTLIEDFTCQKEFFDKLNKIHNGFKIELNSNMAYNIIKELQDIIKPKEEGKNNEENNI